MQHAYLLHARPYRETSQLLDVLTYDSGRIQLIVRGVRGAKKKQPLQLFMPYQLAFTGKSELKTLTHYESLRGRLLSADQGLSGKALYCGFYINELLTRLLPREEPMAEVFVLYQNLLAQLTVSAEMAAIQTALREFEFALLDTLGYGYDYTHDVRQQPIEPEREYYFYLQEGFAPANESAHGDGTARFLGADILAFDTREFGAAQQQAAKRFMRLALDVHLGDKPLKSRELFL